MLIKSLANAKSNLSPCVAKPLRPADATHAVSTRGSWRLWLLLALGTLVSACGQKMPVYLPTAAQQQALDERQARIEARREAQRNATPEQRQATEDRLQYGRERAQQYREQQRKTD